MSLFKSKADRAKDAGITTALEIANYASLATPVLFSRATSVAGGFSGSTNAKADVLSSLCGVLAYLILRVDESRYSPVEINSFRESLRFCLSIGIAEEIHGVREDKSAAAATGARVMDRLDAIASQLSRADATEIVADGAILIAEAVLPADVDPSLKDEFGMHCLSAIASGVARIRPSK